MPSKAIERIRAGLASKGFNIYTGTELWETREDFPISVAPLSYLLGGSMAAGWTILLGGGAGTGKTTLAKAIVSDHLHALPDRVALVGDIEEAEDGNPQRRRITQWNDLDDRVGIIRWSGSGEGFFDGIIEQVQTQEPICALVLDSADALVPRKEHEADMNKGQAMALQASMFSNIFRKAKGILSLCHISTIWISQKRQNPSAGGAADYYRGNAMRHGVDITVVLTGGIHSTSARYDNPFTGEVMGALSTLRLDRKRKGHGIPLHEIDMAITFQGGIDLEFNLVIVLEKMEIGYTPRARQHSLPIDEETWQKVEADLVDNLNPEYCGTTDWKEFADYKNGHLVISHGEKIARGWRLAGMMKASPLLYRTLFNLHLEGLRLEPSQRPRRTTYPGPFMYPSPETIKEMLTEIESVAEVE